MLGIFRNPDSANGHQFLDEEVKLDHYLIGCVVGSRVGSWVRAIVKRGGAFWQQLGNLRGAKNNGLISMRNHLMSPWCTLSGEL
jgi:hypothetical protein